MLTITVPATRQGLAEAEALINRIEKGEPAAALATKRRGRPPKAAALLRTLTAKRRGGRALKSGKRSPLHGLIAKTRAKRVTLRSALVGGKRRVLRPNDPAPGLPVQENPPRKKRGPGRPRGSKNRAPKAARKARVAGKRNTKERKEAILAQILDLLKQKGEMRIDELCAATGARPMEIGGLLGSHRRWGHKPDVQAVKIDGVTTFVVSQGA